MRKTALSRLSLAPASRALAASWVARVPSLAVVSSLALLAGGCMPGLQTTIWGQDVRGGKGGLSVDGVRLPHERWVPVTLDLAGTSELALSTATGTMELAGQEGDAAELEALLFSEIEGDGEVVLENGRLRARGGQGKAFVNAWRGRLPNGRGLTLSSGTGALRLAGLTCKTLDLDTGTGELGLHDVSAGTLGVDTGTGDVTLRGGEIGRLEIESGTGDVTLAEARCDDASIESGTGDLVVEGCSLGALRFGSGTGDLSMSGGRCGLLTFEPGTGDCVLRGDAVVERSIAPAGRIRRAGGGATKGV